MNTKIHTLLPWMLVAGGTFIIQYHSMAFWSRNVNADIGWVWSIVIEAGSLWLWYRPRIASRLLGLAMSVLLLAGPLYQVGEHALAVQAKTTAAARVIAVRRAAAVQGVQSVRARLAQDARLLHVFMENSKKRSGWLPAMQKIRKRMDNEQERINQLNKKLDKMAGNVATKGLPVILLVLLQALGLTLVQVANVLAITSISRNRRACSISTPYMHGCTDNARLCTDEEISGDNQVDEPVAVQKSVQGVQDGCTPCTDDARLHMLRDEMRAWIEREGLSIASAALKLGVDRPSLSYLLRWEHPGDRKPPGDVLMKIHHRADAGVGTI